jgi:hypothetical protein
MMLDGFALPSPPAATPLLQRFHLGL